MSPPALGSFTRHYEHLADAGFPWATLSLKNVRFRDETLLNLFKSGTETKPRQIEAILNRYPQRQFLLIGDNGEQDPEVYGNIERRYPEQITQILIRNVADERRNESRYTTAFRKGASNKWQFFNEVPSSLEFPHETKQ